MSYQVNKKKCLGVNRCGVCLNICPGATQEGKDGKAEVVNQKKLQECGGERVCPMGAIEKVENGSEETSKESRSSLQVQNISPAQGGRGLGRGEEGKGLGRGAGRGLGRGPQDGKGGGKGRGRGRRDF